MCLGKCAIIQGGSERLSIVATRGEVVRAISRVYWGKRRGTCLVTGGIEVFLGLVPIMGDII